MQKITSNALVKLGMSFRLFRFHLPKISLPKT